MAQRIRTRNQGSVTCHFTSLRPLGGTHNVFRSYPTLKTNVEVIVDDNSKGQKRFKPVAHTKTIDTPVYSPQLHLLEQDLYLGLATQWREGNQGADLLNQFSATGILNFTTPTLANQSAAILKELFVGCLPSLNDGNSAVNFLLELRDIRSLARTAAHLRRLSSQLKRKIRTLKPSGNPSGAHSASKAQSSAVATAKAAADVHLSYSFGVAPFISDVKRMVKTMRTLKDRIEWLEANQNKTIVRHNRIKLTPPSFVDGDVQDWTGSMSSYYSGTWGAGTITGRIKRSWVVPPVLIGTLKYTYALTSSVPLKDSLSTYLSAFGVEANPKIAWDAIPFSFLVDWVVDVGEFLGSFKIDALGIRTVVLDYCYSIKWHAIANCWVSEYNPYRQKQTSFILTRQVERTRYERLVGVPSMTAIDTSGLGSREFLLGGSLALAGHRPLSSTGRRKANPNKR